MVRQDHTEVFLFPCSRFVVYNDISAYVFKIKFCESLSASSCSSKSATIKKFKAGYAGDYVSWKLVLIATSRIIREQADCRYSRPRWRKSFHGKALKLSGAMNWTPAATVASSRCEMEAISLDWHAQLVSCLCWDHQRETHRMTPSSRTGRWTIHWVYRTHSDIRWAEAPMWIMDTYMRLMFEALLECWLSRQVDWKL